MKRRALPQNLVPVATLMDWTCPSVMGQCCARRASVSYTHLDVYKRQHHGHCVESRQECGDRCRHHHGDKRSSGASHRAYHHSGLAVALRNRSTRPICCAGHQWNHRPSGGCDRFAAAYVEFECSIHCYDRIFWQRESRPGLGSECGHNRHHGDVYKRQASACATRNG